MGAAKVAVSLDRETLERLDRAVTAGTFPSRSRGVQLAVEEKLARLERTRLAEQCRQLDPAYERALAEEGLSEELEAWPEY